MSIAGSCRRAFGATVAILVLTGATPGGIERPEDSPDAARSDDVSAAGPEAGSAPLAAQTKPAQAPPFVYVPPELGFPARRMGGGTRGMGRRSSLQVLAPDHLAYTTLDQPTLYWYLAEPTPFRIDFTIRDETSVEPLAEVSLDAPPAGIHGVRLADLGVRLEVGTRYLWFVSLVSDPHRRSKDFTVGAWISRRAPDSALRERLAGNGAREALVYAESGLWYDAVATLSSQIEAAPVDEALREQRAELAEQAGLSEVAAHDRAHAAGR